MPSVTIKFIRVYTPSQKVVIEQKSFTDRTAPKEKARDWVAAENKKSTTSKIVWFDFI